MNLNNVLAFGSTVDVLLICNYEVEIGGHTYSPGEPFTLLKSVQVGIDSQAEAPQVINVTPSNIGLSLVNQTSYLYRLTIGGVTMSSKISDLFFTKNLAASNVVMLNSIEHPQMKLAHTPTSIFLYYQKNGMTFHLAPSQYTIADDWLTLLDMDSDAIYFGFYYYTDLDFRQFSSETYPYFKAIVYGKGNVNGATTTNTLIFEKLSLMPTTNFDFAGSTQNNVNLIFGIIDAEKTVSIKFE